MSTSNKKTEYGILYVFDNGETAQEWYENKGERDKYFFSEYLYEGHTEEKQYKHFGKLLINTSRLLYAKAIERDVLKELLS